MTEKLLSSMRGGGDRGVRWERNLMRTKWRSYSIYSSKFTTAIKRQTAAEEVEEWRLEGQRRGIKKSNKSMDGSFEIGSREIGEKMTKVVNQWWLAHRLDTIFKKKTEVFDSVMTRAFSSSPSLWARDLQQPTTPGEPKRLYECD